MALIERLCQVDPDEPGGEPYERHMALNPFCEALFSVLGGYHTVSQVKGFYNMTVEDEDEMDTIIAAVTSVPQLAERALKIHRIRSVLTFWEQGDVPGYQTVAQIRGHLLDTL